LFLKDHEEGFSAIELVIVLAVTGLLAAIALPRWRALVQIHELNNSVRQIQSELHALKSRAAAENVSFQISYSQGATGYTIQRENVALVTKSLAEGTTITKAGTIAFSPRGTAVANRVRLLDAQGVCRQIVVSPTGRVRWCTPSNCAGDC
jgi:prepilin-type N-terminal cleavage/methylation domain-containing protein